MQNRASFFFLLQEIANVRKEFGKCYLFNYLLGQARYHRNNLPKLPS